MATDGGNAGRMPHSMPAGSADAGEEEEQAAGGSPSSLSSGARAEGQNPGLSASRPLPIREEPCSHCGGAGYRISTFAIGLVDPPPRITCTVCNGTGSVPVPSVPLGDETEALRAAFRFIDNGEGLKGAVNEALAQAKRANAAEARVAGLEAREAALRDALSSILTTIEDANQPYERLGIGAIARAALAALPADSGDAA